MVLFVVPPAAISPSGDVSSRGKDPQFTPRMNQVLQHSSQVSLNLGNDRVGDEHLLLGALYDKGGVAEQVLHELGVAYETVYELVASKPGTPPAEKSETSAAPMPILPPSQVRMTPGAVRVFEIARQQAEDDELTDGMLSTHHYLLALMIEGAFSTEGGLAAKVLNSFGITYGSLIARIDELGVEGTSDAFDWSASPPPHNDAT